VFTIVVIVLHTEPSRRLNLILVLFVQKLFELCSVRAEFGALAFLSE
jgi:hypothetical protein